jgi:hypothetical protein
MTHKQFEMHLLLMGFSYQKNSMLNSRRKYIQHVWKNSEHRLVKNPIHSFYEISTRTSTGFTGKRLDGFQNIINYLSTGHPDGNNRKIKK